MKYLSHSLVLLGIVSMAPLNASADTLIFKDGERLHGTYIRTENGKIIFRSKNVGDVAVPQEEVTLEVTTISPPPSTPMDAQTSGVAGTGTGYGRILAMGRHMERELVRWWEPWKGRVAVSLDVVNDSSEHSDFVAEARARREWAHDEVQLEGRYEHQRQNGDTTVDLFRALGDWKHDIGTRYFAEYRPELDRDRAPSPTVQPFPYLMLEQQLGLGYHILKQERGKIRVGVGEVFYNVWALNDAERSSRRTESMFLEGELQLPWRVTATERAVIDHSFNDQTSGFSNEFEFSKKVTESLSVGIRQEFRKNNPDPRVTDYERLRFLVGYDF